mgnify:CR=1 FL=1
MAVAESACRACTLSTPPYLSLRELLLNLSFDSLRTRIVVFFAALLIIVQAVALLLLNTTNHQIAKETIEQELGVGERIFLRLLEQNRDQLEQSAALLASDFGFRQAVGTNDNATVLSALTDHGARAAARFSALVDASRTSTWPASMTVGGIWAFCFGKPT